MKLLRCILNRPLLFVAAFCLCPASCDRCVNVQGSGVLPVFTGSNPEEFVGDGPADLHLRDEDNVTMDALSEYILTPPAPAEPRINGPKIYGERPGRPFFFRIPASGDRPMTFFAKGLPAGLKLDPETGFITGAVRKCGTWEATVGARNAKGEAERELKIVIGDDIALTPPMGWSSWNCCGSGVTEGMIKANARALYERGLVNYGWSYVNVDDGWGGLRGGKHNAVQGNRKFPDMGALAAYVHSLGLKFGLYSSPWCGTYAGYLGCSSDEADGVPAWVKENRIDENCRIVRKADGSTEDAMEEVHYFGKYSFVKNEVAQWADWGVDYLKYDWGPMDPVSAKEMSDALRECGRDIVFSISNCAFLAQGPYWTDFVTSWRSTGDIRPTWESMSHIGFDMQERWGPYVRPGHWADADMLEVGNPRLMGYPGLNANEQYTHFSLWALLSSPLLIGCNLATADDFTISLLSNSEVIDVNQDPLGFPATRIPDPLMHPAHRSDIAYDDYAILEKPLEDGSVAVGLFNRTDKPISLGFDPYHLGVFGAGAVIRDLWRQKDIAVVEDGWDRWDTVVEPHGVVLVKVSFGPGNRTL